MPPQLSEGFILTAEDPPPFEAVNPEGHAPLLLVCDHASPRIPRALGDLGLPRAERERHIGWDIGAAAVTRHLAARFDAPALLAGYSRLVVDCNRHLSDPAAAPAVSDGTRIPANLALPPDALAARAEAVYWPYHRAIEAALERFAARGVAPLFVSIHSCTPVMQGRFRPWQIGLCWDGDRRLAAPLLERLEAQPDLRIGHNEPYCLDETDYTVPVHAMRRDLRHIQVEFRQDLIAEAAGAAHWAEVFAAALAPSLAEAA